MKDLVAFNLIPIDPKQLASTNFKPTIALPSQPTFNPANSIEIRVHRASPRQLRLSRYTGKRRTISKPRSLRGRGHEGALRELTLVLSNGGATRAAPLGLVTIPRESGRTRQRSSSESKCCLWSIHKHSREKAWKERSRVNRSGEKRKKEREGGAGWSRVKRSGLGLSGESETRGPDTLVSILVDPNPWSRKEPPGTLLPILLPVRGASASPNLRRLERAPVCFTSYTRHRGIIAAGAPLCMCNSKRINELCASRC